MRLVFWFTLGLLLATLFEPETVIKGAAVVWLGMVVAWTGYGLFWRWCLKHGKTEIKWIRCKHRAHSIHCETMRPGETKCTCEPSHPVNCGHCK